MRDFRAAWRPTRTVDVALSRISGLGVNEILVLAANNRVTVVEKAGLVRFPWCLRAVEKPVMT